ncbi:hypothetical protein HDU96_003848 [Phlyctochytrium bullatum]|nr:hypothetical protein HDU96_003848 [Phlyctochytrium bullatum]
MDLFLSEPRLTRILRQYRSKLQALQHAIQSSPTSLSSAFASKPTDRFAPAAAPKPSLHRRYRRDTHRTSRPDTVPTDAPPCDPDPQYDRPPPLRRADSFQKHLENDPEGLVRLTFDSPIYKFVVAVQDQFRDCLERLWCHERSGVGTPVTSPKGKSAAAVESPRAARRSNKDPVSLAMLACFEVGRMEAKREMEEEEESGDEEESGLAEFVPAHFAPYILLQYVVELSKYYLTWADLYPELIRACIDAGAREQGFDLLCHMWTLLGPRQLHFLWYFESKSASLHKRAAWLAFLALHTPHDALLRPRFTAFVWGLDAVTGSLCAQHALAALLAPPAKHLRKALADPRAPAAPLLWRLLSCPCIAPRAGAACRCCPLLGAVAAAAGPFTPDIAWLALVAFCHRPHNSGDAKTLWRLCRMAEDQAFRVFRMPPAPEWLVRVASMSGVLEEMGETRLAMKVVADVVAALEEGDVAGAEVKALEERRLALEEKMRISKAVGACWTFEPFVEDWILELPKTASPEGVRTRSRPLPPDPFPLAVDFLEEIDSDEIKIDAGLSVVDVVDLTAFDAALSGDEVEGVVDLDASPAPRTRRPPSIDSSPAKRARRERAVPEADEQDEFLVLPVRRGMAFGTPRVAGREPLRPVAAQEEMATPTRKVGDGKEDLDDVVEVVDGEDVLAMTPFKGFKGFVGVWGQGSFKRTL